MKNKNIFLVKFTAVAVALSVFSPTVSIKTQSAEDSIAQSIPMQISVSFLNEAHANKIHKKDIKRKKNVNRNVNRNINRNVHPRRHDNFYRGGGYYVGGHYHPVAKFTMVALSGLAIGSIISSSSMSSDCSTVSANGKNYKKCDGTYFEPFYEGDNLQYKAVNSPL